MQNRGRGQERAKATGCGPWAGHRQSPVLRSRSRALDKASRAIRAAEILLEASEVDFAALAAPEVEELVERQAGLLDDVPERTFAQVFGVPWNRDAEVGFHVDTVTSTLAGKPEPGSFKNRGHFAWPQSGQSGHLSYTAI